MGKNLNMSEMLDKAVEQAKRLPIDQQEAIAAIIMEEIVGAKHGRLHGLTATISG